MKEEDDFLKGLEAFTYSRKEIVGGQATAVKYFVSEIAVKDCFKRFCKDVKIKFDKRFLEEVKK